MAFLVVVDGVTSAVTPIFVLEGFVGSAFFAMNIKGNTDPGIASE